ncbi:MAG: hypothetical protein DWQ02_21205 [Bacteroidetes bacterium]|nr:MAG: hypothetical protein DWQ02_21205 [Bacteroidota bacterium]
MMYLLTSLVFLFIVGIFVKKYIPNLCALCFAVSTTWLAGLVYTKLNVKGLGGIDTTALGILIGGSAVGGMYYIFRHGNPKWEVFKLPYLLSTFTVIYFLLVWDIELVAFIFLGILWMIFFLVYLFRGQGFSNWFNKIVECCKNW